MVFYQKHGYYISQVPLFIFDQSQSKPMGEEGGRWEKGQFVWGWKPEMSSVLSHREVTTIDVYMTMLLVLTTRSWCLPEVMGYANNCDLSPGCPCIETKPINNVWFISWLKLKTVPKFFEEESHNWVLPGIIFIFTYLYFKYLCLLSACVSVSFLFGDKGPFVTVGRVSYGLSLWMKLPQ